MPTKVIIFVQDHNHPDNQNKRFFEPDWSLIRKPLLEYKTKLSADKAPKEAFNLTNMPMEFVPESDLPKLKGFRGPSLSIGDMVQTQENGKCAQHLVTPSGFERQDVKNPLPGIPKKQSIDIDKLNAEEKGKLFKRIQGLINDYSGEYFSMLKGYNINQPNKRVRQFIDRLLKADSPEAEREIMHSKGRELFLDQKKKQEIAKEQNKDEDLQPSF